MNSVVLDASAVLAVIFGESGPERVLPALPGTLLSSVNLAEVATHALDLGNPLEETARQIQRLPLRVVPYDTEQAYVTAGLRPACRPLGLSLGDRVCLSLGLTRQAAVLTGDRQWALADSGIEIILVR